VTGYYVTLIRDKRVRYLSGPFDFPPTQQMIDAAFQRANNYDPWTWFDKVGSAKVTAEKLPDGIFKINA